MKKITRPCCVKFKRTIPFFTALLLIVLIIASCNKFMDDFDPDRIIEPEWNPEFAIPLVNSTYTIKDFFEDSGDFYIRTNPDNSLTFIYGSDELFSQTAEDIIKFPDQNFSYHIEEDVPPLPPGFFDTLNFDYTYQFITETIGQRLDSIFLKNGQLYIHVISNLNRNEAEVKMLMPDIVNIASREPLTIQGSLNNPGGQQAWVEFEQYFELNEYEIFFNVDSLAGNNTISFLLEVVVHGDDNPDLSPYEFNFDGYLMNIEFEKAFGYFGQYEMSFTDSINIDLFDKTIHGGIQVGPDAIDISMDIFNSFGTPVVFAADELYVTSTKNPPYHVDINLYGSGIPNIFFVNAPDINQIGQTIETNLDFYHSNLGEAFNLAPEEFYFDLLAFTNPEANTTATNFLLDTSSIHLSVDIEMKLFASISDFVVEDTVDFDLDQDAEGIDNLLIRLNAINRFPIDADIQVYFTDDSYQVLDSLIDTHDERVLVGAPVGGPPEYRVTDSTHSTSDFSLSKTKINNILNAKKLLLYAALSTTDGQLSIIYNDYSITIKIGTIAGVNITDQ